MPADRFFLDDPLSVGTAIELSGTEWTHLRVMRIAPGETVELVNGKGVLASVKLIELRRNSAIAQIESRHQKELPSSLLTLIVPLMRPAKLEWVVEKTTELGADSLLFYSADQGEKENLSPHQWERLHTISINALKQSGRLYLPSMALVPDLETALRGKESWLFGSFAAEAIPLVRAERSSQTCFVTGPEKGFSEEEEKILAMKGIPVSLGPFTLRAETAPIAGAAILSNILIGK